MAIARTSPQYGDNREVREIEALYLDAIARAERTIYCESQYFASRRVAEAIAVRLKEPEGPEVIIINPESAEGFLETVTMDTARARLLDLVRKADLFGRFRIYTPVNESRTPIYVHAKILIVDDWLLRVGSSNLNNRSMGFDTECDLAIEAPLGQPSQAENRARIAEIRNDLLSEHLGVSPEVVAQTIEQADGSAVKAIDSLMSDRRSLVAYQAKPIAFYEEPFTENELLDPERPPTFKRTLFNLFSLKKAPVR